MTTIHIRIQSLADVSKGIPILDDIRDTTGPPGGNIQEDGELTIAFLEGGMQSGKMSVMFILSYPGKPGQPRQHHIAECSSQNFEGLIGAFKGAMQRFHPDSKLN
jgi:hypothetical protein